MEIYGCLIAGIGLKDIQTIVEERDNKFVNNTQTKRIATKYSRDMDYDFSDKRTASVEYEHSHSFVFPILPQEK